MPLRRAECCRISPRLSPPDCCTTAAITHGLVACLLGLPHQWQHQSDGEGKIGAAVTDLSLQCVYSCSSQPEPLRTNLKRWGVSPLTLSQAGLTEWCRALCSHLAKKAHKEVKSTHGTQCSHSLVLWLAALYFQGAAYCECAKQGSRLRLLLSDARGRR